jgi:hypothetical protein
MRRQITNGIDVVHLQHERIHVTLKVYQKTGL